MKPRKINREQTPNGDDLATDSKHKDASPPVSSRNFRFLTGRLATFRSKRSQLVQRPVADETTKSNGCNIEFRAVGKLHQWMIGTPNFEFPSLDKKAWRYIHQDSPDNPACHVLTGDVAQLQH